MESKCIQGIDVGRCLDIDLTAHFRELECQAHKARRAHVLRVKCSNVIDRLDWFSRTQVLNVHLMFAQRILPNLVSQFTRKSQKWRFSRVPFSTGYVKYGNKLSDVKWLTSAFVWNVWEWRY